MSNFGVWGQRLDANSQALTKFDKALLELRKKTVLKDDAKKAIIEVMEPLSRALSGNFPDSDSYDVLSIIEIIRKKKMGESVRYEKELIALNNKLKSDKFTFTDNDFSILNEIAEAMDFECSTIFQRMRENR